MMLQRGVPEKVSASAELHAYQSRGVSHGRADYSRGKSSVRQLLHGCVYQRQHDSQMSSGSRGEEGGGEKNNTFVIKTQVVQHESEASPKEQKSFPRQIWS